MAGVVMGPNSCPNLLRFSAVIGMAPGCIAIDGSCGE